jgi:hypothetical protein
MSTFQGSVSADGNVMAYADSRSNSVGVLTRTACGEFQTVLDERGLPIDIAKEFHRSPDALLSIQHARAVLDRMQLGVRFK